MEIVKNEPQIENDESLKIPKGSPTPPVSLPEYDRKKNYSWKPDDIFQFGGGEFGVTLNALKGIVQSPEGQRILMAAKALEIMEAALAQAVHEGVAKEMVEPKLVK